VGGGLRVPLIKETISKAIGDPAIPLSTHVNGDESMSFGASFIAANNSAQFAVRDVFLHQMIPQNVVVKITGPTETIEKTLFHEGESFGKSHKFNVNSSEDITLEFTVGDKKIAEAKIINITEIKERPEASINASTPQVQFQVSYNKNGLIEVSKVQVSMNQNLVREVPRRVKKEKPKEEEKEEVKVDDDDEEDDEAVDGVKLKKVNID
jgi:hypoxia up-regulated 1